MIFWTDERVEELKAMHAAGWTAAHMADVLGTSRNAILGKVFRLGLSSEQRVSAHPRAKARGQFSRGEFRREPDKTPPPASLDNARFSFTAAHSRRFVTSAGPELTKNELRRMLADAVKNTAR